MIIYNILAYQIKHFFTKDQEKDPLKEFSLKKTMSIFSVEIAQCKFANGCLSRITRAIA